MNKHISIFFDNQNEHIDSTPLLLRVLLVTSFFIATLVNIYPGISIISMGIFLFLCLYLRKVSLIFSFQFLMILLYFNASALLFYTGFGESYLSREFFLDSLLNNLLAFNFFLIAGFVISVSYTKSISFYAEIFANVLIIHLALLFIQFLVNYLFGFFIDYNQILTGTDSRIYNYKCGEVICTSNRYTGFFVEPSTFTTAITALFIIVSMKYRLKSTGLLTMVAAYFLAFSTAGLAQAILVIASYLLILDLRRSQFIIWIISISSAFLLIINFLLPYFLIGVEVSGGSRSRYLEYLSQNFDLFNIFFGSGIFDKQDDFFNLSKGEIAQGRIASFNDLGTFVFVFATGGIASLLLLFFRFFEYSMNIRIFVVILMFFSLKLGYHHALFWLCLFTISYAYEFNEK